MTTTKTIASVLLIGVCALTLRAQDAAAPAATEPAAVTGEQLLALLPKTIGPLAQRDPTVLIDPSGMGVVGASAHYKISDDRPEFGDCYLRDYGGNDFTRMGIDALAKIETRDTPAGHYEAITVDGYPAVEYAPKDSSARDVTVVVNHRFIVVFQSSTLGDGMKAAVEAYDFKPLAALGK